MRSVLTILGCCLALCNAVQSGLTRADERPNILIAISDDQSYPYASAYGCSGIETPAFDQVAQHGVLFTNAFAASPGCSPSRAALLTGRHTWQIEEAGTHASSFPIEYATFPEVLAKAGYFVGHTGKGWGPGNYKVDGRQHNPAGPAFSKNQAKPPHGGISRNDYAANFAAFLDERPAGEPFCFWYGAVEPHRVFEKGVGLKVGKKLEEAQVPSFLPDTPEVRSDILDYYVEIEWFDAHLARMLEALEAAGELDQTIVIVTSDNGMAFPRAKANCYEYGTHVPLAVSWPKRVPSGRVVDDLVGFVDLTATIFEAAGVDSQTIGHALAGRSLLPTLASQQSGTVDASRDAVFTARERHSSSRYHNLAYPQHAMRTPEHLYIRNYRPERWPAGAPQKFDANGELGPPHGGYHDIDACPTLTHLVEGRDNPDIAPFFHAAVDHRPAIELFDIKADPGCLRNLAALPEFAELTATLTEKFDEAMVASGAPRQLNGGEIFETYRRYSRLRQFPEPEHVQQRHEALRAEGWIPLFDGRTLEGWTASKPADSFSVVNGMIRAQATADQSHLFYTGDVNGGDFRDFELMFEAMTTPGSNGGLYFHTSYQETGFPNDGHEVQVNQTHKNRTRTGSLFSVVDLRKSPVEDLQFATLHVTVRGKHVVIKVNGETTVDYVEPDGYQHPRYTGRNVDHGTFALQAHDPDSTVFFRDIWVRPLPAEANE